MNEEIDKQSNEEEEENLSCPDCGNGFQDMRGLTSHARHMHNLNKTELNYELKKSNKNGWKGIVGIREF